MRWLRLSFLSLLLGFVLAYGFLSPAATSSDEKILTDQDIFGADDPFARMEEMHKKVLQQMGKMMEMDDDFFGDSTTSYHSQLDSLKIEEHEDNQYKYVEIDSHGIDKNSLQLSVEKGQIQISGKQRIEETTEKDSFRGKSVYMSTFQRSIPVPMGVDENQVKIEQQKDKIVLKFPRQKV